ncbi:hypothetical protein KIN20_013708 [Parelaphostrongylus tenuis]|uniref:Uncharacterized protein n=1 Tax=Parelaphostrongylus tenuis TaxID=148309 RepID=A0AAD5MG01_PARTN|nr:hypothetical protein KIN20_013708 [Parelaphostrongylus tenuis]
MANIANCHTKNTGARWGAGNNHDKTFGHSFHAFTASPSVSAVLGCGVMPAGQARARPFTVSGFSLPVSMVYSTAADVQAQVRGIARNRGAAQRFVQRIVMQTMFLERQARSALLPDALVSTILGQLTISITYEPMECPAVAITRKEKDLYFLQSVRETIRLPRRCIIASNTVTGICNGGNVDRECSMPMPLPGGPKMTSVTTNYTSISGVLSTTNFVMANWSRMMWQSVVDRAVRMLASGPFGSNFFSASGTVAGN